MEAVDPGQALEAAIARAERFGWQVVRRKRRSAELCDATGGNRLYLDVGDDGVMRDRQAVGSLRRDTAARPRFRTRPAVLVLCATLATLLGLGIGLALAVAPAVRARVGAAPTAAATEADVARAIRAEPTITSAARFDRLQVAVSSGSVVIAVQPRLLAGTDALTVASSDMLVAARSVFRSFPDVTEITVALFGSAGTMPGPRPVQMLALIRLSSQTASGLDLATLEARVLTDNTALFCHADGYRIAPLLYQELVQERQSGGCLTSATK